MLTQETAAHLSVWDDLKRSSNAFLNARSSANANENDPTGDSKGRIKRQLEETTAAWSQLQGEMETRKRALDECLESAQFYSDAEEDRRWIAEKMGLIQSAGILTAAVENPKELEHALNLCGSDYSATQVTYFL